jgi:isocitrate lyase
MSRPNPLLAALERERPLQIAGAINAYAALLAQDAGFRALYLSGSGVASASFGLPDLAMTTLSEVVAETRTMQCSPESIDRIYQPASLLRQERGDRCATRETHVALRSKSDRAL